MATRTVQPIGRKEYEAMTREDHERVQIFALCDLPKTPKMTPGEVDGTLIGVHEYLKIADKLTGARVVQWDHEYLIGEAPRRLVIVDQSNAEVSSLLRAWNKNEA